MISAITLIKHFFFAAGKSLDMIPFIAVIISVPALRSEDTPSRQAVQHKPFKTIGSVTYQSLKEISGIVPAETFAGFWVHNDSGDQANLYAVATDGGLIATYQLDGVVATDWEDIAAFNYQGERFLVIGDIGDNHAQRQSVQVHILTEPTPKTNAMQHQTVLTEVINTITFSYDGGPRDAEGLAIDVANQQALILSKREIPVGLFTLSLEQFFKKPIGEKEPAKNTLVSQRVANVPLPIPSESIRKQKGIWAFTAYQPTAIDFNSENGLFLIATYGQAFIFNKHATMTWNEAFDNQPKAVPIPVLRQTEATCFSGDSKAVIITTERLPAPIMSSPIELAQPVEAFLAQSTAPRDK
jgi:hypothetical protein